jgi:hypothetical protein
MQIWDLPLGGAALQRPDEGLLLISALGDEWANLLFYHHPNPQLP